MDVTIRVRFAIVLFPLFRTNAGLRRVCKPSPGFHVPIYNNIISVVIHNSLTFDITVYAQDVSVPNQRKQERLP